MMLKMTRADLSNMNMSMVVMILGMGAWLSSSSALALGCLAVCRRHDRSPGGNSLSPAGFCCTVQERDPDKPGGRVLWACCGSGTTPLLSQQGQSGLHTHQPLVPSPQYPDNCKFRSHQGPSP